MSSVLCLYSVNYSSKHFVTSQRERHLIHFINSTLSFHCDTGVALIKKKNNTKKINYTVITRLIEVNLYTNIKEQKTVNCEEAGFRGFGKVQNMSVSDL